MNRGRWLACWLGSCLALALGCGGDDSSGPCASGSFCEDNLQALDYDCKQSVMCRAQNGDTLEDDPVSGCIRATAEILEGDGDAQQQFLANFNNCSQLVVCPYYQCVQADVRSYGETQRPNITFDCQQNIQCMVDTGLTPEPGAQENCVSSSVMALNTLNNTRRISFEQTYRMCSGYVSCDWVNCFIY